MNQANTLTMTQNFYSNPGRWETGRHPALEPHVMGAARKQIAVLDAIQAGKHWITAIAHHSGVHTKTVQRILTQAEKDGIVKRIDMEGKMADWWGLV